MKRGSSLHPLLSATTERGRRGRLYWRLQPETPMLLEFVRAERASFIPEFKPFDLEREGGVRLFVVEDDNGFDFYFQGHHASMDGLGGLQVVHDLLLLYQRELGKKLEVVPKALESLPDRNRFIKGFGNRWRSIPTVLKGLLVGFLAQRRRGQPLVPHVPPRDEEPALQPWPRVLCAVFPAETYGLLRRQTRKRGVTMNDILIRDFQVAMGSWRRERGYGTEEDWIRLAVPISLRKPGGSDQTASNKISLVTIDRQLRSLRKERRQRLLVRAHEDMSRVKDKGLERIFLWMLTVYRILPGGIPAHFRRERCVSSAVFGYLGRIFSVGPLANSERKLAVEGAVLENIRLTPPLRPQSLVSIDAYVYARRLRLDFHYDPRFLPEDQAQDLLDRLVANIKRSAGRREAES